MDQICENSYRFKKFFLNIILLARTFLYYVSFKGWGGRPLKKFEVEEGRNFKVVLLRMRDSYTNPYETKRIESFEIFGLTNRIHETGI